MALGALRPGLVYCPGDWVLQLASMDDFHFSQQRLSGGPATQPPDGQRGPMRSMCELAKGIVTVAHQGQVAPRPPGGSQGGSGDPVAILRQMAHMLLCRDA